MTSSVRVQPVAPPLRHAPPAGARARGVALTVVPYHGDGVAWDAFVDADRQGTIAHRAAWRNVLREACGHDSVYLVAYNAHDEWMGVLPLAWVRSVVFGRFLISMPFLNAGGPLGTSAARAALARAARDEAARRGADLLELRCRESCEGLTQHARKITVRLPLPPSSDELMRGFPAKLRSQIRRPIKAGLTVRFGAGERRAFHEVYSRHMRDLGSPSMGERWFAIMARAFPQAIEFAVVYDGAKPVAAGCGFGWRGEFELVWAAALRSASKLAPNMLLYWSMIERAIEKGRSVFDFGRCTPGSGTHRFKQQWRGMDVSLPWCHWSARGASAPPTPDSGRYRAAVQVWQRLPPAITRVCGPALARFIP